MKIKIFNLQRFQTINIGTGVVHSVVSGTSDNDSIRNEGNMITVKAGAGNDTVYNYNAQLARTYLGDGNDSVYNYGSNNGIIYAESGNDTVSVIYSEKVTVSGGDGNDSIYCYNDYDDNGNNSISAGAGNDTIVLGNWGSDEKIETISGGKGDDIVSLNGGYNKNLIQYTNGDGYDVIYGFNSDDTLKVTGKTISTMESGSDVYVTVGEGTMVLKNASEFFSSSNLVTVQGGGNTDDGDADADTDADSDSDDEDTGITVTGGVVKVDNNFDGKKISVSDYSGVTKVNAAAVTKNISIVGSAKNNSLVGGSGADTISGREGTDTLTGGGGKDIFVHSVGNDIITDYVAGTDKIKFSNATNIASAIKNSVISGSNVILTTSSGKVTIQGAANKSVTFLNKNNQSTEIKFTASDDDDSDNETLTVASNFSGSTIDLTDSKYKNYVSVNASKYKKKGLEIFGNAKNNSLIGGTKNDTLRGGKGNDTLKGGAGSDKFVHSEGNDFIVDYQVGKDKIYLSKTEIIGVDFDVDDLILSTDNGSLKIKNGYGKKITVVDSARIETTKIYGVLENGLTYKNNNTVLKVAKSFAGDTIDLADFVTTVKTVDASACVENIEIVGNKKNNSIVGGAGSDTLAGGAGNDILTGNGGKDIFIHSAGDDVITDYTAKQDKIYLLDTEVTGFKLGANDAIFTTSTGTITVKNGTGKNISVFDSDGEEKIYSKNSSANLAEITENNFVGEFENIQSEKLTQENLITFTDK